MDREALVGEVLQGSSSEVSSKVLFVDEGVRDSEVEDGGKDCDHSCQ